MSHVRVVAPDGAVEFEAEPGERLLHAGLRAGAGLPYECATGTCGSCRATVLSGTVERLWPEAPGAQSFRTEDVVLTCQVAARGDVILRVRGALAQCRGGPPGYVGGHVTKQRRRSPEIAEFQVALDEPMLFTAGQFVLLEFSGLPGPRAYSPIRRPGAAPGVLDLLVRQGAADGACALLFGASPAGLPVRVFGPLGTAVFDAAERRPFVAIAGGSGIAGILSILDEAAHAGHFTTYPSALVFGLRSPAAAYLLDDLAAKVRAASGGLAVTIAFSDVAADDAMRRDYPDLTFAHGFAHDAARTVLPGIGPNPLHYVAGPPAMVNAALLMLVTELRVSPQEIRYDRFG